MKKACKQCGCEMDVKPSHFDKVVYCSKKCMAEDYRERYVGKANPHYSNASHRACIVCGKPFESYQKTRKYCSTECYIATGIPSENGKRNRKHTWTCKVCGKEVKPRNKLCDGCRPKRAEQFCKVCGAKVESKSKRTFCDSCKRQGKHKVAPPTSVCQACGVEFPGYKRKYCGPCFRQVCAMPRSTPRRVDENQGEIVAVLEAAGWLILDLSAVGRGCPDLLALKNQCAVLIEVKNPKAKGKLNKRQIEWHEAAAVHGYTVAVVHDPEEALQAVGAIE